MPYLDRSISIGGLTLHYVEWGASQARPLVLLHGITGHARTWDRLAPELARRYRVLALDQRGHGDSDPAPDGEYRTATLADDLAGFVDKLALGAFTLVGLSMGGRVAIAYAGAYPARVERLVIVDIGPDIHLPGLERIRGMMAGAPEQIASEEQAVEYIRNANPLYDEAELRHRARHGLKRLTDGTLSWKYDKALREMMRLGARRDTIDLWEPLGQITCPTLLVRGAESDILSSDIAKKMLRSLRQGRLVEVAGAGHTVPGDQPAEFARVVRSFLEA
ncbi:MAG TPA: alpha/beta fold hydrolase [Methylomirabilota bacterium]|nr:alpha/beta fold hydrolase [Methylomirabilota bacterium]